MGEGRVKRGGNEGVKGKVNGEILVWGVRE